MSLSLGELRVVCEAAQALVDGVVQKVRAIAYEPAAFLLEVRAPGETHRLVISATPGATRIHRVADAPPQPGRPPAFVMLLRKHIIGARVASLACADDDRIVRVVLDARAPHDAPPDAAPRRALSLVAELTGAKGCVFLLDDSDHILGALGRPHDATRPLRVGAMWEAPPPPEPRLDVREAWVADVERAAAQHYRDAVQLAARDRELAPLRKAARRAHKKTRRAVDNVAKDVDATRNADALQTRADLLRSAYGSVARGARVARVQDWTAEGAPWVEIPLDPALDLDANIARLYRRAKRLRRGAETASARLDSLRRDLQRLDALVARVEASDDPEAVAAWLAEAGVRVARQRGPSRRGDAEARRPYHAFTSSDGLPIWVGRGASDNDTLTFRVARGNDLWLHAADVAGSHVIVRVPKGQDVPHRTLLEAALLAAHYSKAREDGVVAVHWCQRKHVRKPKGAGPGRVSLGGAKGIDVRMDPDAIAALFATRSDD